jgi:murein endopeptidase
MDRNEELGGVAAVVYDGAGGSVAPILFDEEESEETAGCTAPADPDDLTERATVAAAGGLRHVNRQLPSPRVGAGYYRSAGNPAHQFGTVNVIAALLQIGEAWESFHPGPTPLFGIGEISKEGGGPLPPHVSHRKGVDVDIRILRSDGAKSPTRITAASYSRQRTTELIRFILAHSTIPVKLILFNDPVIHSAPEFRSVVQPYPGHDNHLHVRFRDPDYP